MWPRFGIKVGNSTLCIAYVRVDGKVEVIANKQGDRVSQACLLWEGANEIECGLTAKQKMAGRPKQTVANSFQLLLPPDALCETAVKAATKEIPCEYDADNHVFQLKHMDVDDNSKECKKELSAYNVQVELLRAELELARQYHGNDKEKPIVILSIPSFYPGAAWSSLARAAEEAGFHVAQVIPEPTAAILAYGVGESTPVGKTKYVLTIKSGGLFSHFAIYAVRNGFYTLLDSHGPYPIGGRHFTEALVQFICEEFLRKYKLDPHESRRSIAKIRTAAANCKHILTTLPSTQLYIDSLMDGVDFNTQMSRARFESLIQPVIANLMQTLCECVERTQQKHTEITQIDDIVLLGATMQIPKLQSIIATRFPQAQIHSSVSADEVVAVGCARQGTFLVDPQGQDLKMIEAGACSEEELLIWHGDDESNAQLLIGKGTALPRKVYLEIKRSESADNAEMFQLRSGESITAVCLNGAAPATGDVFRIEAEVGWKQQENESLAPVVKLRCV